MQFYRLAVLQSHATTPSRLPNGSRPLILIKDWLHSVISSVAYNT
jgi:hypothetical protein